MGSLGHAMDPKDIEIEFLQRKIAAAEQRLALFDAHGHDVPTAMDRLAAAETELQAERKAKIRADCERESAEDRLVKCRAGAQRAADALDLIIRAWERARTKFFRQAPYPDRGGWCVICLTNQRNGHDPECPVRIMDEARKSAGI